jgi:hypothetical protein
MAKAIDTMKKSESVINRRALLGRGAAVAAATATAAVPSAKPQSRCSPPAISVAKCWH